MDNKRKDHPYLKTPPKRSCSHQLQTHIVPADDVKILKAHIREEIYDSLISCGLFPGEQQGERQYIVHPQGQQNETEKSSYDVDWLLKKAYGMSPKAGW